MKITSYYTDGSFEEYNTDSHFSSNGLFHSNGTCGVSCVVDVSNLEYGLFVQFWQHDLSDPLALNDQAVESWTRRSYQPRIARINYYGDDQVLDQEKIQRVMSVYSEGELILCRLRADASIIVWSRFERLCALYLKNHNEMPYIERVARLYDIMHGNVAHGIKPVLEQLPGESDNQYDERIAGVLGWNVDDMKDAYDQFSLELVSSKDDMQGEDEFEGDVIDDFDPEYDAIES